MLNKIWSNRTAILEGIKNRVFKNEHVEQIAAERMAICKECPDFDDKGDHCLVAGTQPCCGQCGCSLELKLRSLSSGCGNEEKPRWHALLSQEEEDALTNQLNSNQDGDNIHSGDA
jgi:hypothetical protein